MTQKAESPTVPDSHMHRAMEQSAMHSARVALARWASGTPRAEMQLERALRPTNQALWHERKQANFMAWLASGGFRADAVGDAPQPAMPAVESARLHVTGTSRTSDRQHA